MPSIALEPYLEALHAGDARAATAFVLDPLERSLRTQTMFLLALPVRAEPRFAEVSTREGLSSICIAAALNGPTGGELVRVRCFRQLRPERVARLVGRIGLDEALLVQPRERKLVFTLLSAHCMESPLGSFLRLEEGLIAFFGRILPERRVTFFARPSHSPMECLATAAFEEQRWGHRNHHAFSGGRLGGCACVSSAVASARTSGDRK